jgi:hypothetical protein
MKAMLGISQLTKMLYLPYYAYVFSSTKLEIRAERFCLEVGVGGGIGWGWGAEGRNDPNNACTCE